jgi:hypothetical protein
MQTEVSLSCPDNEAIYPCIDRMPTVLIYAQYTHIPHIGQPFTHTQVPTHAYGGRDEGGCLVYMCV